MRSFGRGKCPFLFSLADAPSVTCVTVPSRQGHSLRLNDLHIFDIVKGGLGVP